MINKIRLNVLGFEQKRKQITVNVSYNPTKVSFRLWGHDSVVDNAIAGQDPDKPLYCIFDQTNADSWQLTKAVGPDLCNAGEKYWSFAFLKKYYNYLLQQYFQSKGLITSGNFIDDTEVWIPDTSAYSNCLGYRSYTLRVQFSKPEYSPEILVAMGDIKSVFKQTLNDAFFSELPGDLFTRVLYKNKIYRYNNMPDEARRHLNELYPCVNFELLNALNIKRPAPEQGNRYLKYSEAIEQFRLEYLYDKDLQEYIDIDKNWKTEQPQCLDMCNSMQLQFGDGQHTDPMKGMRNYGPAELIKDETVFFFIYHDDDKPLAISLNEYMAGLKADFEAGVAGFLRMKYNTVPGLSISFSKKNNPLPEIKEKLDTRPFDPAKNYVAFYLSPHGKWTTNTQSKSVYYHLKELLLSYGVVSQTIDANKARSNDRAVITVDGIEKAVMKAGFHYNLPNILVAIHAKLGASPWCFEKQAEQELVIGISAYESRDLNNRYVGSAFSFTNQGRFQGFNCFRNNQLTELSGSIALAVKEFCAGKKELQRLIIHFYKRLSKKELRPIEKMLSLLGLDIPVIVVSVNKSFSADVLGFDDTVEHKMPSAGSYLCMANGQYLLYNNNQCGNGIKSSTRDSFPFPLKINIQKFNVGSSEAATVSSHEEQQLLLQVCRFSQLYWKSVSRQWLPVTLRYPEMLAQIAPHFKYGDIPEAGRDKLWFL